MRSGPATVFAAALLSLAGAALGAGLQWKGSSPHGTLRVSRPEIRWDVWTTGSERIASAEVTIDGVRVDGGYDLDAKRVLARPDRPLGAGEHEVAVALRFEGGYRVWRRWKFRVEPEAIAELPLPEPSQTAALEAVNAFRRTLGLPEFRPNAALNIAALAHTRYNELNRTTGHYQREGKPGFCGADPSDRLASFGYVGDSWEAVCMGRTDPHEAVRALVAGPYHRLPFLQPGGLGLGAGHIGERLTLLFELGGDRGTVVYPYEGQRDVPTRWSGMERPNPLRIHKGAAGVVGYPIVFAHFDGPDNRIERVRASLRTAHGDVVECYVNTPANDEWLRNAAALIPVRPLEPGTTYVAEVHATTDRGDGLHREWRFTAAR